MVLHLSGLSIFIIYDFFDLCDVCIYIIGKSKIEWNNSRGGILATMSSEEISIYNINYLGEYCPRWLYSKCGVDMGFGGKIISWGNQYIISQSSSSNASAVETPNKIKKKLKIPPNINIDYLPKSDAMIARAKQFEKTLNSLNTPNDLIQFIQFKLKELNRIKIAMQNKPKKDDKGNDSDKARVIRYKYIQKCTVLRDI